MRSHLPLNIRLDEDFLKTSFAFVLRRRLQNVFKMSWSRSMYSSWPYVFKTSCQDVFKTSSKRLQDVLPKRLAMMPLRSFEDIAFKTFWRRTIRLRCSTGLKIGVWLRVWNIELTLVPSRQNEPTKYSVGKHVWLRFWKNKRSWWDSKKNECLCGSNRPNGSLEKVLREIWQNSRENICARMSFLIKLLTL